MNAQTHTTWPTPDDQAWADRVLLRLHLTHDVPAKVGQAALSEARLACLDSGEPPAELFGAPDVYAAEVARHRVPEEWRAGADLDGAAPTDALTMLLLGGGWLICVASVVLFVAQGWTVDLTRAGLTLALGTTVASVAALSGLAVRHAGHVRRSWWWGAVGIVGLAVGGSSVTLPAGASLVRLPVVLVLAVGIGMLVAGMKTTPGDRTVDPERLRDAAPDDWFDHLAGLLRGRYYMRLPAVHGHVADARAHWADSQTEHPADEFGAPEVYALRLSESSTRPGLGRERVHAWFWTFVAVTWGVWVVRDLMDGDLGGTWFWRVPGLIFFVLAAAGAWRGLRTEETTGDQPKG
ncbi:hypothetical protein [Sanguibacter sp. 25GB23B1]|uniref:hypothetical protein n=1 Tax=unclassified Sanguibacter TaxID=2645534 RepID=UPI0032AEB8BC